jgi:hypothetical protein
MLLPKFASVLCGTVWARTPVQTVALLWPCDGSMCPFHGK